jgi:hypothetical protein
VEDLIYMEGSEILHHEPGLFDECLSVQSDGIPFQGQYCTVFFELKLIDQINANQSYISNTPREEQHISTFTKGPVLVSVYLRPAVHVI